MAGEDVVVAEAREGMKKSLDSLHTDLGKIRSGRANPVLLENVTVDYYGTPTPLRSLANITAPEVRQLVVQPYDRAALGEIERAILKADLGLVPQNDGKLIRVPIPQLTEERRRELVKAVKKLGEDHKLGVRHSRRDAIALVKEMEKDGELSEDDGRRAQKKIQDLTDDFSKKIDETVQVKEEEILRV
jgi:ribosome recycling factor